MSQKSIRSTAMNYGLIAGAITVLIFVIQYAMGDYVLGNNRGGNWVYGVLSTIAAITVAVMGIANYKKSDGGFVSFGQAFKLCFSIYIYSTLVGIVWLLLYMFVLEPNYIDISMEAMEEQIYETNPDLDDAAMEQALNMSSMFLSPLWIILASIIFTAIWGSIVGLILAAIMKKNKPEHLVAAEAEAEAEGEG